MNLTPHELQSYLRSKGLQLRPRGSNKVEAKRCPFCDGGNHNDYWKFVVYLDGGNYKCMRGSCDVTGTFWSLAEHFGDDPKDYYPLKERRESFIRPPVQTYTTPQIKKSALSDEAVKYLYARKFSDKTIEKCKLFSEDGNICFPYYKGEDLVMVKYRRPRKPQKGEAKAWQSGGGLRTLWGIEDCDLEKYPAILITFGEYDRMACVEAGIVNAVSVPCGDKDLEWINVCWDELAQCKEIYLWPDNDESGRKVVAEIAQRIGKHKVRLIWTDRKDANEVLFYDGADAVWDAMCSSEWYQRSDLKDAGDYRRKELEHSGYSTGFPCLDQWLGGMIKGKLTVHTGNTAAGKSTAVNQMIAAAMADGARVCVWPGEDQEDDFQEKIRIHIAGREGTELMTNRFGSEYSVIKADWWDRVNEWLRGKMYVLDKQIGVTEDVLMENFTIAQQRYGCDVFVVDNLMALVTSRDTTSVHFRQAQVVQAMAAFAKSANVHVHLITHTSKANSEDLPPQSVRDVSGASEIVNFADSCISWWRVPDGRAADFGGMDSVVTILKNRKFGKPAQRYLAYSGRMKSLSEDRYNLYSFSMEGK